MILAAVTVRAPVVDSIAFAPSEARCRAEHWTEGDRTVHRRQVGRDVIVHEQQQQPQQYERSCRHRLQNTEPSLQFVAVAASAYTETNEKYNVSHTVGVMYYCSHIYRTAESIRTLTYHDMSASC